MLQDFNHAQGTVSQNDASAVLVIVHPQRLFYDPAYVSDDGESFGTPETLRAMKNILQVAQTFSAAGLPIYISAIVSFNIGRVWDQNIAAVEDIQNDLQDEDISTAQKRNFIRELARLETEQKNLIKRSAGGIHPALLKLASDNNILATDGNSVYSSFSGFGSIEPLDAAQTVWYAGYNTHACLRDTVLESWSCDEDQQKKEIYVIMDAIASGRSGTPQFIESALQDMKKEQGVYFIKTAELLKKYPLIGHSCKTFDVAPQ